MKPNGWLALTVILLATAVLIAVWDFQNQKATIHLVNAGSRTITEVELHMRDFHERFEGLAPGETSTWRERIPGGRPLTVTFRFDSGAPLVHEEPHMTNHRIMTLEVTDTGIKQRVEVEGYL